MDKEDIGCGWSMKFAHVSYAAKNRDATVETLAKSGIRPFEVYEFPPMLGLPRLRGRPVHPDLGVEVIMPKGAWIGGPEIEIQQATKGSLYLDFVARRGEGYHHLAFVVDSLDRAVADLEKQGMEVTFAGEWEDGGWAYVESEELGGMVFELFQNADLLGESTQISSAFRSFSHVGVVAPDLDRTMRFLGGLGSSPGMPSTFSEQRTAVSGGETMNTKCKGMSTVLGGAALELLQPGEGWSPYSDFLRATGGGIHHLAFNVADADGETARLRQLGGRVLFTGRRGGRRLIELELSASGFIVDLVEPV